MGIENFNINSNNAGKVYAAAQKLQSLGGNLEPLTYSNSSPSVRRSASAENFTEEEFQQELDGRDKDVKAGTLKHFTEEDRALAELIYAMVDTDGNGNITKDEWEAFDGGIGHNNEIGYKEFQNMGSPTLESIMEACEQFDTNYIPEQYEEPVEETEDATNTTTTTTVGPEKDSATTTTGSNSDIDAMLAEALIEKAVNGDAEAAAALINGYGVSADDGFVQALTSQYRDDKDFVLTNDSVESSLLQKALSGDVDSANILFNSYDYDKSNDNYKTLMDLFQDNKNFVKYKK